MGERKKGGVLGEEGGLCGKKGRGKSMWEEYRSREGYEGKSEEEGVGGKN